MAEKEGMSEALAPAWYVIRSKNILARWFNSLHWPYTVLHLSFVVLGLALVPTLYLERSVAVVVAFFLAMGVGAHALDLLAGDPLKLSLPKRHLQVAAAASISAAVAIGAYYTIALELWWYWLLVVFGGFIVVAYNLELFGGWFHSDHWFASSWGAFPFAAGYLINHGAVTYELVLGMIFCYCIARLQRVLSTRARMIRRRVSKVEGWYHVSGDHSYQLTLAWLIDPVERGLMWLCVSVPILAFLLLLWVR